MAPDIVAYRLLVIEAFMKARLPIEKVDQLRSILEDRHTALTRASHMRLLVPLQAQRYLAKDKVAIHNLPVSVIFDGTGRMGELLIVLVRFPSGIEFQQRLARLRHSEDPLDADTLKFVLDRALNKLDVRSEQVVAFIKDSASVNSKAVRELQRVDRATNLPRDYIHALNMPCFSHILNRVGKKLHLPLANQLIAKFSAYFQKSSKVQYDLSSTLILTGSRRMGSI